jgi:hypothetical protein
VDESLKNIRLLHVLLVGMCAAILGFALSAENFDQYDPTASNFDRLQVVPRKTVPVERQKVSLMGLDVRAKTAIYFAPPLTLVFMLTFLSYTKNIQPHTLDQITQLAGFPWIGLFSDALSRSLLLLSIVTMPVGSNLALLWSVSPPEASAWIAYGTTIAIAFVSFLAVHDLWRLQALARRGRDVAAVKALSDPI